MNSKRLAIFNSTHMNIFVFKESSDVFGPSPAYSYLPPGHVPAGTYLGGTIEPIQTGGVRIAPTGVATQDAVGAARQNLLASGAPSMGGGAPAAALGLNQHAPQGARKELMMNSRPREARLSLV